MLGSSLIAPGGYGAPDMLPPAQATPTAVTLLSGAKSPEGDFHATTGFRLIQNTILLDALPGNTSAEQSFVLDSGAPMTLSRRSWRATSLCCHWRTSDWLGQRAVISRYRSRKSPR